MGSKKGVGIIIGILLIIAFVFGLQMVNQWEEGQDYPTKDPNELNPPVEFNGQEYVLKDNVETLLIMGLDKYEDAIDNSSYYNDQQADFMMLIVLDNEAKTYETIHIDRDTMAEINVLGLAGQKVGTVTKQIALSHTYGNGRAVSCRNAADAVSGLLMGMKVDHYISLPMDSMMKFNDLVGGVEVSMLEDFTDIDPTFVKDATVTLMGEKALAYVRTRYGLNDSSNESRMLRQRQYLEALFDKTAECVENDDSFIVDASLEMADYLLSNLTLNELQETFEKVSEYTGGEIRSLDGEFEMGENGFMEFYADEASVQEVVIDLFYELKE